MKHLFPPFLCFLFLFYEAQSQNVGIGTTNPIYTADIADSVSGTVLRLRTISNTIGDRTLLRMTTSTSNSLNGFNSSYIGNQRQATGSALVFGTASSLSLAPAERMRLNEDGFLGIGTEAPLSRLHIDMSNVNTTSTAMIINDDDDPIVYFQRNNINGGFLQYLGNDFKIGTPINNNTGSFIVRTNGTDRAWFTSNGRLGLGTGTPASQFHLTGDITMQSGNPSIVLQDAGGNSKGFIQVINGDEMQIGTSSVNTTGSFIVRTNGANRLTITSNGLLGLGTGSPMGQIHIESSIVPNPLVINTVGTRSLEFWRSGLPSSYMEFAGDNFSIGTRSENTNGDFIIVTHATPRIRVMQDGKIGVGTSYSNAQFRMAVLGEIICEDITTAPFNTWPDYVFGKDHPLLSLTEIENFIQKNHHLPGIPSAAEIAVTGIQLGDMQKRMMEKIEELTLYIIELNKKSEILQKEIQLLKNK